MELEEFLFFVDSFFGIINTITIKHWKNHWTYIDKVCGIYIFGVYTA